jgi:hypothetical protein
MVEQRLIDLVAGEVRIPDRLTDGVEVRVCIGQRHAGSAAAEIAEHHNAVRWQSRSRLQGRECGDGIGDQRGDLAVGRQVRGGAQRAPQRADGRSAPMRGHRDRDGCTSADGAGHRVESFNEHLLAAVR